MKISHVTIAMSLWFVATFSVMTCLCLLGYNPILLVWSMRGDTIARTWLAFNFALTCFGYLSLLLQYSCSRKKEDMAQVVALFWMLLHMGLSSLRCIRKHDAYPVGYCLCYVTIFSLILHDRMSRLGLLHGLSPMWRSTFLRLKGAWCDLVYSFECILADEEVALVGSKYGLDHLTKEMIIVDEENQIMRETAAKKLLALW